MPALIYISPPEPTTVSVTSPSAVICSLAEAVDIGQYDWLDLELVVVGSSFVSGTLPKWVVGISTGFQIQTEDGWVNNHSSDANSNYDITSSIGTVYPGAQAVAVKAFGGLVPGGTPTPLFRYVRWVVQTTGAPSSAQLVFYLRGMARRIAS